MAGFCDPDDVRTALQKAQLGGSVSPEMIEPAIEGASNWFARQTNGHWFDSTAGSDSDSTNDFLHTSAESATTVRLGVPSSPHQQDRQLFSDEHGARYPVTHDGPYARIPLAHLYVDAVTKLEVRDLGGGVEDWVAASDMVEGRGEDYYIQRKGQNSYGRTYLYIRAASIGPRINFGGLLTLAYDYGLDWQTEQWNDVKRGIANLAAAEAVDDDNVLAQIPDNGQLIGVQTQHENLLQAANRNLDPYISAVSG